VCRIQRFKYMGTFYKSIMIHEIKVKGDKIKRKKEGDIELEDNVYALTLAILELADSIKETGRYLK